MESQMWLHYWFIRLQISWSIISSNGRSASTVPKCNLRVAPLLVEARYHTMPYQVATIVLLPNHVMGSMRLSAAAAFPFSSHRALHVGHCSTMPVSYAGGVAAP